MNMAIRECLLEYIRDYWGLSMQELTQVTGLPRRLIQRDLDDLVAEQVLAQEGGRYVVR